MNHKYMKNIATLALCLLFVFAYYQVDFQKTQSKQKSVTSNYHTIVFKDQSDTLIPVTVNLKCANEPENNYREMIETMKSSDYQHLGLYPILSSQLELRNLIIEKTALTFDFSNHLKVSNNQEALDIFEALSYTFCHNTINKINLQIDGKPISYLKNSTINTNCITQNLGINNFQSSSNHLYQTSSVLVYNPKTIAGHTYYVPTSTRIQNSDNDVSQEVSLLLDQINYSTKIKTNESCSFNQGVLSVHLDDSVLQDSETIDQHLYLQLTKSLQSLPGVKQVDLYIHDQLIEENKKVDHLIDNRIKL